MIQSKGEAGPETTRPRMRAIDIRRLTSMSETNTRQKNYKRPELVAEVQLGQAGLPVTLFTAGGYRHARRRGDDDTLGAKRRRRAAQVAEAPFAAAIRQGHHVLRRSRCAGQGVARAGREDDGERGVDEIAVGHRLAQRGWREPATSRRASRVDREIMILKQRVDSAGSVFGPRYSTFGGHVADQSLVSAVRAVDRGMRSLHGYFLRPGDARAHGFLVERIRDGGSFCTSRINTQSSTHIPAWRRSRLSRRAYPRGVHASPALAARRPAGVELDRFSMMPGSGSSTEVGRVHRAPGAPAAFYTRQGFPTRSVASPP